MPVPESVWGMCMLTAHVTYPNLALCPACGRMWPRTAGGRTGGRAAGHCITFFYKNGIFAEIGTGCQAQTCTAPMAPTARYDPPLRPRPHPITSRLPCLARRAGCASPRLARCRCAPLSVAAFLLFLLPFKSAWHHPPLHHPLPTHPPRRHIPPCRMASANTQLPPPPPVAT